MALMAITLSNTTARTLAKRDSAWDQFYCRQRPLQVRWRDKCEQALAELRELPFSPSEIDDEIRYVAKKLDLSEHQLREIIDLPAKWFWDYPNDDKKLTFIYNAYRKLFKREKLDRF